MRIDHWGGVAINGNAKIGSNCHIFGDVTIGVKDNLGSKEPQIGDNVTIGASARIIGPIKIASNCIIGANAVVTHSVLEERKTIVGIPGRVLK
ncbi:serine O-acetyltransferase [Limosilactobacillus balticus]|uniref:serine O-acetyltransferase n=1 Tax=Limosilactobacillus balticus TaxID=2759747 RepID=UPI0022AB2842|nr:DapH/DapD/GlmU-related protein [Limosilactobacillus balticus]